MANTINSLISSGAVQGAYSRSKELSADSVQNPGAVSGQSFSDILQKAADEAIAKVSETDAVMESGLKGKVETQQIVEAIMALETSVTVAVSVRDKFVAAYQEILRMPV